MVRWSELCCLFGACSLLVSCLKCEAHCDVSHNELVLLQLEGKLEKGEFDARAGVIAGSILMEDATVNGQSVHSRNEQERGMSCMLFVCSDDAESAGQHSRTQGQGLSGTGGGSCGLHEQVCGALQGYSLTGGS